MIIGVDYTAAAWQGAGIGRYTREIIRAAIAMGGPFQYRLFYAARGLPNHSPYLADLHALCAAYPTVRAIPLPLTPRALTIIWQRLRLPLYAEYFTGHLDVLHAPDFVLPPTRRARTLVTAHDLSFLIHPEWFTPSLQRYLTRVVPRNLRRANLVLAVSHNTRNDLARLVGIPHERIVTIHHGVSSRFQPLHPTTTEPTRQQLGLPEHFLLFVGTLEPRKNLVRLIEAFHYLVTIWHSNHPHQPCPHLVLAGRKGWLYDDIFATVKDYHLESRVFFPGFIDDDTLPTLYNLADVFVYPSLYEGFGLPVVEAMACGTPTVTAATSSLPEVAGNAAILVDPTDSRAIARGIGKAIEQRELLQDRARKQAQRFTWDQAARALLACYFRVLQHDT